MNYISVDHDHLLRYCGNNNLCFWSYMALVSPIGRSEQYFFDCSLYKLVKREHASNPDTRFLLAFKNPVSATQLSFTDRMGYGELPESPCTREDLEHYVRSAIEALDKIVGEAREAVREPSTREKILRFIVPARSGVTERSVYYGLLLRKSLLNEMIARLGYVNNTLNANVSPVRVLFSVNLRKEEFMALIHDKRVKLKAYSGVIDVDLLVKALKNN